MEQPGSGLMVTGTTDNDRPGLGGAGRPEVSLAAVRRPVPDGVHASSWPPRSGSRVIATVLCRAVHRITTGSWRPKAWGPASGGSSQVRSTTVPYSVRLTTCRHAAPAASSSPIQTSAATTRAISTPRGEGTVRSPTVAGPGSSKRCFCQSSGSACPPHIAASRARKRLAQRLTLVGSGERDASEVAGPLTELCASGRCEEYVAAWPGRRPFSLASDGARSRHLAAGGNSLLGLVQ